MLIKVKQILKMDNNYLLPGTVLPSDWSYKQHLMTYDNLTFKMPILIILCGIPTSGKSTWAKKYAKKSYFPGDDFRNFRILSRDEIRMDMYGKYKKVPFTRTSESIVTHTQQEYLRKYMENKFNIIIDNTHVKEEYIKELLNIFGGKGYMIKIKFFDIPLWKAYYRNVKRRILTGKNIPIKVLKNMKKSYDKINQKAYANYKL
jgi:predicted kinase